MNTSKPISTVSFNSMPFFLSKADELVDNRTISFYAFIFHFGEPSESKDTLKDHIHFYCEPNRRIDTMSLGNQFKEPVSTDELPLACLPFWNSNSFADWYYYILHDPIYLARKGMSRYYIYKQEDIITSDKDYLKEKINSINTFEFNYYADIAAHQEKGYNFEQYMIVKNIHPMQIKAFRIAWDMVSITKSATHEATAKEEASDESHLLETKEEF